MKIAALIAALIVLPLASCDDPSQPDDGPHMAFYLPEGDAVAGRAAFKTMCCYARHPVAGDQLPPPVATPAVPVRLGPLQTQWTRAALAESIIAPSHQVPAGIEHVAHEDGSSRMGEFNQFMTVEQLIDIVAYLKTLGSGQPGLHQTKTDEGVLP